MTLPDRQPAVFMRDGTSQGRMFRREHLPGDRADRDALLLAMGSPDPHRRQLDGMVGGLSPPSKVCVVGPSARPDADVEYTFAQVMIGASRLEYGANCGNMSAAVGPFACDEDLARPAANARGEVTQRLFNTNTGRVIASTCRVAGGRAVEASELAIPGVAGTGNPVRLDFLDPGAAVSGRLLPTGSVVDRLAEDVAGEVQVTMVDAGNACVFVAAASLGLPAPSSPPNSKATGR